MNAIFQMLNPSNTLTVNRLLAHAIGLSEAVIYAALISKCSYYERNGMLDDGGWFYSTVPDLEASTALSEYQHREYRAYFKAHFRGRKEADVHKAGCGSVL